MEAVFKPEFNYISEAKYFLMRYYSKTDFKATQHSMKNKAGYNETLEHLLDDLQEVYVNILNAYGELPESLSIYFQSIMDEDIMYTCMADGMLIEGECALNTPLMEQTSYMKQRYHKNNRAFIQCILNPGGSDDMDPMKEDEFFHELENLHIKDELKWNVWRVYSNYDEHLDQLMEVVLKLVPIMKDVYKTHIEVFQPSYLYWKNACEQETLFDILHEEISLNIEDKKDDSIVHVTLSWMEGASLRLIGVEDKRKNLYMHIGIIIKEYCKIINSELFTRADICNRLKLLSDESKYEILKQTKSKKYYGAQLADTLQLTTATISHHVSSLVNSNLLTMEKDSNRIYYRLNKDQIGFILDQIRKDLYED